MKRWLAIDYGERRIGVAVSDPTGTIATPVGELLLTHIPPWTSREDVISEAKAEFDGPVHAVVCGETFDVRR